ncbi:hypothetical protein FOL47_011318 [Perkinsus chesapeaki]|uniref:N-acetyltransferase domain-containing protein n=1 Tax=Perkinsus chesapeaki TaxID=330153 RepID=A0A7J6MNA3_PERCH|nr:hypothetical protein FOL47_011318 [Perkinsus chesapeaki]
MRSSYILSIVSIILLPSTADIEYRYYQPGDHFDSSYLFYWSCEAREEGIPCYVAVNLEEGAQAVIGFIWMTIPKTLSKEQDAAVRAKMPDPKKKGSFGYIDQVEVDSDFRGRGIGRSLVKLGIKLGKEKGMLGMTLNVIKDEEVPMALYESLGFIKVLEEPSKLYLFALYF